MILSHHVLMRGKLNKAVLLFVKIKRELARLLGRPRPLFPRIRSARPSRSNPLTIKKGRPVGRPFLLWRIGDSAFAPRLPASGLQPAFGTTAPSLARCLVASARPSGSNPLFSSNKKGALTDSLLENRGFEPLAY